ncbi:hypothetical protein IF1G_00966 [Cordyceps javanica]|uniref:Uncharacterized protein n=1 Tax=Cordyceps javanica TaxID=43265 RepID=A0A545VH34_9HYPO|nr:hypothetical protein IF1G_00966 [Cordyceps javanica]
MKWHGAGAKNFDPSPRVSFVTDHAKRTAGKSDGPFPTMSCVAGPGVWSTNYRAYCRELHDRPQVWCVPILPTFQGIISALHAARVRAGWSPHSE